MQHDWDAHACSGMLCIPAAIWFLIGLHGGSCLNLYVPSWKLNLIGNHSMSDDDDDDDDADINHSMKLCTLTAV